MIPSDPGSLRPVDPRASRSTPTAAPARPGEPTGSRVPPDRAPARSRSRAARRPACSSSAGSPRSSGSCAIFVALLAGGSAARRDPARPPASSSLSVGLVAGAGSQGIERRARGDGRVRGPLAVPGLRGVGAGVAARGHRHRHPAHRRRRRRRRAGRAARVRRGPGAHLRRADPPARRRHRRAVVGRDGGAAVRSAGARRAGERRAVGRPGDPGHDPRSRSILVQIFPVTPVSPLPPTGEPVGLRAQPPGGGGHRADRRGAAVPRLRDDRLGAVDRGPPRRSIRGRAVLRRGPRPDDQRRVGGRGRSGSRSSGSPRGSRSRSRSAGCSCSGGASGRRSACTRRSTGSC